jgi:hypothetical protein
VKRLLAVLVLGLLAACAEDAQELRVSSEQAAAQDQQREAGRRDRTSGQNEAARIYR